MKSYLCKYLISCSERKCVLFFCSCKVPGNHWNEHMRALPVALIAIIQWILWARAQRYKCPVCSLWCDDLVLNQCQCKWNVMVNMFWISSKKLILYSQFLPGWFPLCLTLHPLPCLSPFLPPPSWFPSHWFLKDRRVALLFKVLCVLSLFAHRSILCWTDVELITCALFRFHLTSSRFVTSV